MGREPANISFIPTDANGGTLDIKGQNAVWVGLANRQTQYWAYQYCSPLASVIDRLAEADISGELQFVRSKGKGKDDFATSPYAERVKALFNKPNPMQDYWDWRAEQVLIKKIYGFCPVYVVNTIPSDISMSSYMFNLDPRFFGIEITGKQFSQKEIKGIISKYTISTINGETLPIDPENIIILKDSFFKDENYKGMVPKSKMVGLDMAVSNYCAAMEADNVLLRKKGPLGAWTHDAAATKDTVAGYLPMSDTEKKAVQTSLDTMGVQWDQFKHAVTATAVKWQKVSFDVRELGTSETIVKSSKEICHRYGYSYTLLEDTDTTFANGTNAHKALYQNNIIPNNERDMQVFDNYFKLGENNIRIYTDYSGLAIMQEDAKLKAEALKYNNQAQEIAYINDMITKNQWLTSMGLDTVPDGDLYYSQSNLKTANDAAAKLALDAKNKNNDTPED